MATDGGGHVVAAARVVTPERTLAPGRVVVDAGRVAAVEPLRAGTSVPERILTAGFVDLQVNGIDDVDVATADVDGFERLDRRLLEQGVTAWCPTLVTAPLETYAAALDRIATAAHRPGRGRPAIVGAHLEGPFLGGAPGAHRPELLLPIDRHWLAALPPVVCLVTVAPELAGAADAVAALRAHGVTVAHGHSTASYEQAEAAIDAGARLVTHLFNGMGPLHHRQPGLPGAALADDRVAVSVIADGVHVHPAVLRAVFRAKGRGGVVLVTDAVAWRAGALAGSPLALERGAPRLADGTLAGSVLSMDGAVRNAVAAGVALEDALAAASTAPAAVLGLDDRGRIEPGMRADLVLLTPDLHVETVFVAGEPVVGAPSG